MDRFPAGVVLRRLTAWCGAAMRGAVAVAGAVTALAVAEPWVSLAWVVPAVTASVVWSGAFAWIAVRRGLHGPVMAVDVALTTILCLGQGLVVAEPVLPGGASWVDGLASMTIVVANFAWRPALAVPAGLVVTVAHFLGARLAEAADGGVLNAGVHLVQIAATAALMTVLRRAAGLADGALSMLRETEREIEVVRARRADEDEQKRRLHNTVLQTLTTVGTNGIPPARAHLVPRRAAADLVVVNRAGQDPPVGERDLAEVLRTVEPHTRVEWDLVGCRVPAPVALAFADATEEALANVARHAGVEVAHVRSVAAEGAVEVEIVDAGRGFDPTRVPLHRYGVRESIIGRMRSVGGDAEIRSGVSGTRVVLRWPC